MIKYIKILKYQKFKIRFVLSRLFIKTGILKNFSFFRNTYKIQLNPSSLTLSMWVNKNERIKEENFICSFLKKGDNVFDVGANIGTVSLACAKIVGITGEVKSFEPSSKIFQYLKNNIEINNYSQIIQAHNFGLGSKNKNYKFTEYSDDTSNTPSDNGKSVITIKKLDDITKEKINFLKIDVEGFEYEVLKGAKNSLKEIEFVYLECNRDLLNKHNSSEKMVCDFLKKLNFIVYQVVNYKLKKNIMNNKKSKMLLAKKITC